jgi:hypothetical protein
MFTGDGELPRSVMARRRDPPSGGACRSEERVWGLDWWGGQPQGPSGRFYRARRGEEGASAGPMAINAMAAPTASKHSGGLEWRGNRRGD